MEVNKNVYGDTLTWVSCYYQQNDLTNKNKKAWFGGSTAQTQLRGGIAAGKLLYTEPINKSLAYCGFGTESALNHRAYIGIDPDNTGAVKIYEYQDTDISNWAFFEKTAQYGETSSLSPSFDNGHIRLDDLGRTAWNENINDEWNYSNYLEPYTFVNPHNMVLLINVIAGASLDTSQTMDLSTYIQNRASFPYLYTVYGNLYFGTLPERNIFAGMGTPPTGWKTSTLQCLDNYVCQAKNIDIPMYSITYGGSCILMGTPTKSRSISRDNDILDIAYVTEEGKQHLKTPTIDGGSHCYIEYYDNLIEDILKTAACLGLYFTPSSAVAINGALTHNDMYIGILDSSGVGHGEYLRGAQTANAPQAAADFTDMHTINYDPVAGDKTKYKNDTEFYTSALANGFTRFWVLNSTGVDALLSELYDIMNDDDPDISIERYNMKVFLTQNPIDAVISLKKFPLDNVPSLAGAYFINIGSKSTNISASPLAASCGIYTFSFKNSTDTSLYPHFKKSFLDYEPYTKAELYIPFCGTYEIPCTYLYDYGGVDVKLIIDFISGACTGYVLCNGICIGSCSGSCAINLPLSGIQSATLDSQIHSASVRDTQRSNSLAAGIAAGAVSIAAGIFTGGTAALIGVAAAAVGIGTAAVKSATEQANIEYEVSHMQTPLKQVSAASGQIAHTYDMRAKMTISRPKISGDYDAEVYANTVGFACIINDKIKNLSGLTQGTVHFKDMVQYDINDNVIATCTDMEKELIRNAFAGGVIL